MNKTDDSKTQKVKNQSVEYDPSKIVDRFCLGAVIDNEFSPSLAKLNHKFSWARIQANPKGDHGEVATRGSWYKTMEYHLLHTGGFVRLCTVRGRGYWNAQNESRHRTPDWKLHFSTSLEDIPTAWDVLAALFMDMKCEIGMKATYLDSSQWSAKQRGRELTVYIFQQDNSFQGYMQGVVPDMDHDFYLGKEFEEVYQAPFWYKFITEAETRLQQAGVKSNGGVASGDLPLPGCRYASLRNEAFVPVRDNDPECKQPAPYVPEHKLEMEYPPNRAGWNAAQHRNPLLSVLFFLANKVDVVMEQRAQRMQVTHGQ